MRRSVRFALALILGPTVPCRAQSGLAPDQVRRIDSVFAVWDSPRSPGCAVGVSNAGDMAFSKGYGQAMFEPAFPITPATVFNIGSTSKQFVAFAILLLADRGKLSLDEDVRRYVSEVPRFKSPITIRHLVHHTSGLRDYASLLSLMGWQQGDQYDERRFLSLIGAQRDLNFPPGSKYLYSNTGFVLLATIVSRVSGMSWVDFADREIFAPLGMTRTMVRRDAALAYPGLAQAYGAGPAGVMRRILPNHDIVGSTAVLTTVGDLARWERNFYQPVVGTSGLLARMHERFVLSTGDTIGYASGLMIERYRGLPLVAHAGGTGAYTAQFLRFPDQRTAVSVLCNAAGAAADGLAHVVADIALGGAFPERRVGGRDTTTFAADSALLADYVGPFVSAGDAVILLERRGNGIVWKLGRTAIPLVIRAKDLFVFGSDTAWIKRDAKGRVTHLERRGDYGPNVRFIRTAGSTVRPRAARYVGTYYSPELDRTWWVSARGDSLFLRRRDFGEVPIAPMFADGFLADGATLRFVGAAGPARELLVSNGRALRVRFARVSR